MHHTVVALVEDKPGVLERVSSQFRRRAFNIVSVSAGRTAPGMSCITVVVDSDKRSVDRVIASISKVINVLQVEDLGDRQAVSSAGVTLRANVLGYFVGQFDFVRPFQRPGRGWMFQFNISPGF